MNHAELAIGLDIGATKILAVVADAEARIAARVKIDSQRERGAEHVFARIAATCEQLLLDWPAVRAVGAGFAGLVDGRRGVVLSSIMLPGWEGYPLAQRLEQALHRPACIDNDATATGLGEYRALGSPPALNMIVLTVGTGIGGAIIVDGRLYRGATGTAGEFGNMTIDYRGEPCWCGSRGCLNMLASASALCRSAADLAERLGHPVTAERVGAAARRGDRGARHLVELAADALGAGVANIVNIFNPDRVVLFGGLTGLGEQYLDRVRQAAAARAFREPMAHVRIERSRLEDATGAFGAACLALDLSSPP
ncbi:MAG: ROK family protein [Planctomycetota bacterium]